MNLCTGRTHLWEYILRLLLVKKYNPSVVRWLDREKGEFKIQSIEQFAKLWGEMKRNPSMTGDQVLRAMR